MDNKGTATYVLGILSCVLGFISLFVFWWLSIVGTILGVIGCITGKDDSRSPKAAFIISIVGLILSIIVFFLSILSIAVLF